MHLVKPILAITFKDEGLLGEFLSSLKLQRLSRPKAFASIQRYYSREMGENLKKIFVSLEGLMEILQLCPFKLWALRMEELYSENGKRGLNIDPGYVDKDHLVLASSKKRGGRLLLCEGVYAEIEYLYVYGGFRPLYWTYTDYRDKETIRFFEMVREDYLKELKTTQHGYKVGLDFLFED